MKVMQSERELAWTLGIPIERLRKMADTPAGNYHEFMRYKDASKTQGRMIRNPKDELKTIQRLIKNRIFTVALMWPLLIKPRLRQTLSDGPATTPQLRWLSLIKQVRPENAGRFDTESSPHFGTVQPVTFSMRRVLVTEL